MKNKVISWITYLKTSTKSERKLKLIEELSKFNIPFREDSKLCKLFIDGNINKSLEEVVSIIRITTFLFTFSHVAWSRNHDEYEEKMRTLVYKYDMSFKDATDKVIKVSPRKL
jgi:hypothetical protein